MKKKVLTATFLLAAICMLKNEKVDHTGNHFFMSKKTQTAYFETNKSELKAGIIPPRIPPRKMHEEPISSATESFQLA